MLPYITESSGNDQFRSQYCSSGDEAVEYVDTYWKMAKVTILGSALPLVGTAVRQCNGERGEEDYIQQKYTIGSLLLKLYFHQPGAELLQGGDFSRAKFA